MSRRLNADAPMLHDAACLSSPVHSSSLGLLPVPHFPRYTPNLSRKCTHVLVDPSCDLATEKLLSLRADRSTWRQEVVSLQWLAACMAGGARVGEAGFRALQVLSRENGWHRV